MAITINVKTLAVHGWDRRNPMAFNSFGDATPGYIRGHIKPNYPVPAIPQIHQWDFPLWVLLETMPPLSDEEWEREEEAWQDYLDSLD